MCAQIPDRIVLVKKVRIPGPCTFSFASLTDRTSNATLDLILSNTNASAVLTNWGPLLLGAIMAISQGNATGYTQVLETHLNAMIMSWGSNDNADHTASVSGCVLSRVATNIGVWLILAIETILLLILGVLDLVTLLILRRNKKMYEKIKDTPSDLVDWQVAFFRNLKKDQEAKFEAKDLRAYSYGWDEGHEMLVLKEDYGRGTQKYKTVPHQDNDLEMEEHLTGEEPRLVGKSVEGHIDT